VRWKALSKGEGLTGRRRDIPLPMTNRSKSGFFN
jgi:hypothetical protein